MAPMEARQKIGRKLFFWFLVTIAITVVVMVTVTDWLGGLLAGSALGLTVVRIVGGSLAILVGLVVATVTAQKLTQAIRSLADATAIISEGDLTRDVQGTSNDELGDLAEAFNGMVGNLRQIVLEVKATSDQVTSAALALSASAEEMNTSTGEIAGTVEQIAKGAEHQAGLVEQVSRLMREMANAINEIAARAKSAAEAASEAGHTAQTGGKSAREAMAKMKEVFAIIEASAQSVRGFSERIAQIGTIVDVITKIAQQTHLLALNAAIEAARAGEAGGAFSVVAEEVRKLATEAGTSAEKIAEIIKDIRAENAKVVDAMAVATREVSAGREAATFTGQALEDIVRVVLEEVKKVQEISGLTQQQTQGAEALVKTMDEIAKVAEDNAASSEEASAATSEQTTSMDHMAESAQQLSAMADKLRSLVARFRVEAAAGRS
jgi:methyl-accepting chemotaxis protein